MTPHNIIKFISKAAPHFDHLPWISSYISSKNRMYPHTLRLFFKGLAPNKFPLLYINFIKSTVWMFKEILLSVRARILFRGTKALFNGLKDQEKLILIKSFAYESSLKNGKFQDPFFKDLIPIFRNKGYEIIFVVDSLTNWHNLVHLEENIVPYQFFYSPLEVIKAYITLLRAACFFPTKKTRTFQAMGELEAKLSQLYYVEVLNPQTLINLLFYYSGKNSAKTFPKANSFLYTYENNCWERTFSFGIKEANSQNKVYAFQHAVMPQASVNMYVGEEELPFVDFTDLIFTTGKYPESLFSELSSISKEKYQTLGTARFNYLHDIQPISRNNFDYEYLIALEGVPQAAEVIERFYKQCKISGKSPKTLLRLHPAFGIDQMQNYLSFDISEAPFITVSKSKTVIEDLEKAELLIYWGSTCALEALKLGKTIIHCKIESDLDFDPLGGLTDNRFVWKKDMSLFSLRKEISFSEEGKRKGIEFVESYFQPLSQPTLEKFF